MCFILSKLIFINIDLYAIGSFSTQIAQSAYDEVKKEVEAEKESKLASGSQDALVSSNRDTWEFMGLKVKPPQVILGVTTGLTDASRRVDTVIADEVRLCL